MIVLRASEYQKKNLDGVRVGNNKIQFTKDGNGEWIIGRQVLDSSVFSEYRSKLIRLTEIEYVPPVIEDYEQL